MGYRQILKILAAKGVSGSLLNDVDFLLSVLDASSDGLLISDSDGNVLYVNSAYEHTTGIRKDDIVGRNLRTLLEENLFNFSASIYVLENKQAVSIIHKYYTGRDALTSAAPIYKDDNIVGTVNNTRNVTEMLRLREQVKESRETEQRYARELEVLRAVHVRIDGIIAESSSMREVLRLAGTAARYDTTVALSGETGTGKEVISKYIHSMSSRKDGPFIKVNCAAIPSDLFESELFGYEPGSFTGASQKGKIGMFELANKGTILLDEVSELPLSMQSKLLRVLQEREIFRVGGSSPIKLDVRVVSATNKELKKEVDEGRFREDLYFRLNVLPIYIPPLRERKDDIELFIMHFLSRLNSKYKKTVTIDQSAKQMLMSYEFPGNVRELQNLIEYLFITAANDEITAIQFPAKIMTASIYADFGKNQKSSNLSMMVEAFEKTVIAGELKNHASIRKAAQSLGMHPSTLCRKIKKYGVNVVGIDLTE